MEIRTLLVLFWHQGSCSHNVVIKFAVPKKQLGGEELHAGGFGSDLSGSKCERQEWVTCHVVTIEDSAGKTCRVILS